MSKILCAKNGAGKESGQEKLIAHGILYYKFSIVQVKNCRLFTASEIYGLNCSRIGNIKTEAIPYIHIS